jgi:hypothetical protein
MEREQKLINLLFEIAQASAHRFHNQPVQNGHVYAKIKDKHMAWVAEQLTKNGFPVMIGEKND